MGKVTTVRLTSREVERLQWLEDRFGLKEAQLIRTAINVYYDSVHLRDELERGARRAGGQGGGLPPMR